MNKTILPAPLWILLICVAIVLTTGCATVATNETERSKDVYSLVNEKGDSIRLHDALCPDTPDWLDLRRAEMHYQGKDYQACWFGIGGHVVIIDSNKDKTAIPQRAFTKEDGT
jgi:hypothetical protein